jgi:hypothetical protein
MRVLTQMRGSGLAMHNKINPRDTQGGVHIAQFPAPAMLNLVAFWRIGELILT